MIGTIVTVISLSLAGLAVADPAVVGVDAGHGNYHTADGRYAPFAALVRAAGDTVTGIAAPFTAESLADLDVLVVANALAPENQGRWSLPTPSAFTPAEIAAVHAWVAVGGGLLLIADHMPFPGAAADLAAAFGVVMENGFVFGPGGEGVLRFEAANGTLAQHPIVNGATAADAVTRVLSFTGQGFRVEPDVDARPLLVLPPGAQLVLPETAWQFTATTPRRDAAGLWQGAALVVGDGRVAVFGEAAMFTSQSGGPGNPPLGFDHPDATGNRRLVANVVRWLAGDLPLR